MAITKDSLLTLEAYAKVRKSSKPEAIAHRRTRSVVLGDHMTLQFEDETTVRRQIQEMLHIEKIFDEDGIQAEIDAYAPLVPDGRNWKATLLIEYPDEEVRRVQLERLKGIEDRCYVQIEGFDRLYAIADEDLERENDVKTSAVHFLRFELGDDMAEALKSGAALSAGIDHPAYQHVLESVPVNLRASLIADLD